MPPDRTQLNRERIDALFDLLEEANIGPTEHMAELREVKGIGEAAEVAEAHRNGRAPPGKGGQ